MSKIVDTGALNSNESLNFISGWFSVRNGFLFRMETQPDYGVDASIEMVNENRAVNRRIQLQIKSVENLKIIRDQEKPFVSYTFKTSDIDYLYNDLLGGIILIYDMADKKCYYDFTNQIRARISQKNVEWAKQNMFKFISQ